MSNIRVLSVLAERNWEGIPDHFCEGYTTEVARSSEGRVIAVIERACLKSAAPVAEILDMNDGTNEIVYFCRVHHSFYREAPCD